MNTDAALLDGAVIHRRRFLFHIGTATVGIGWGMAFHDATAATPRVLDGGAYVSILADGRILIVNPAAEMGQGSMTALPMLVAEELDADWADVEVVQAPSDPVRYGIAGFAGQMLTANSRTTASMFLPLRLAGAQARQVALAAAAANWQVPVSELSTHRSRVMHGASGRRIGFGELAALPTRALQVSTVGPEMLKPASAFRLIGGSPPRKDGVAKCNGSAMFAIDISIPDMCVAVLEKPPTQGGKLLGFDGAAARAVPGVTAVMAVADGIAVAARSYWVAQRARKLLQPRWASGPGADYDSETVLADFAAIAADPAKPGLVVEQVGDAGSAGAGTVEATYVTEHAYHATLEPKCAVVRVAPAGDAAEIWAPTQAQSTLLNTVSALLGTQTAKITLHTTLLGGGYGAKLEQDFVLDAVRVARALKRPVKLMWGREDDLAREKFRPIAAMRVESELAPDGLPATWRYKLVCDSVFARSNPSLLRAQQGLENVAVEGMALPYDVARRRSEYRREPRAQDVGRFRGVGAGFNKFAMESFIDELAGRAGHDPVAYRLAMLRHEPAAAAVVRTAASMAGWKAGDRATQTLGIAYGEYWKTHVALVARVELDRSSGALHVPQVWVAVDPGTVVHRGNTLGQIEGSVAFGIGTALFERVPIVAGVAQPTNFHQYRLPRSGDMPRIDICLMPDGRAPGGIGEVGVPLVAPAVANAFARLTGRRVRRIPMTPDVVNAALA